MWLVLNFETSQFHSFKFPEEVSREMERQIAEGQNEDELVAVHVMDDEQLSVQEFNKTWS